MRTFAAIFYDGKSAVSHEARVTLTAEKLLIKTATGPDVIWPLGELVIEQFPHDGLPAIIGHASMPDAQLHMENASDAKMVLESLPRHVRVNLSWKLPAALAAMVAGLALCVMYVIPRLAMTLAPYVPPSFENRLGEAVYKQLVDRKDVCAEGEGTALLTKLAQQLSPHQNVSITVVRSDKENAFAIPGGYIVFYSALLHEASSPEEIAGILAHELGHLEKRHGMQSLIRAVGIGFLIDAFTGGGGTVVYAGVMLNDLRYSRKHEAEADRYALAMLQKRGIDPSAMAHFFERQIAKEKEEKQSRWKDALQYLSTHPASDERIAAIRDWTNSHKEIFTPALSAEEWSAVKAICNEKADKKQP